MQVAELHRHVSEQVLRDYAVPALFDEAGFLIYLNEGHKQFARRTHCYIDEAEYLTVEEGVSRYALPANTIFLRQLDWNGRYLTHYTRRAKPSYRYTGRPTAFTTDSAQRTVKVYPTPDMAYTLGMSRAVSPEMLAFDDAIDLEHEWAVLLCQWVAYRSLMNNDPDGSDTVAAQPFYESWEMGVREAKAEVIRRASGDAPSAQPRRWVL